MRSVKETEPAWWGRNPREAGGLAEPFGLILGGMSWCPLEERSLAEGKTLARLARLGEPGPWRNFLKSVVGPGRPARGTLVSTVPTAGS